MTRIILFTLFLCLCAFFINLSSYKKVHDDKVVLNRTHLLKTFDDHKKEAAALLAAAENKGNETEEEKEEGLDMNDPAIAASHALYTEGKNCMGCHGAQGEGNEAERSPVIAGQHSWYIIDHINQLADGTRPSTVAQAHKGLEDKEIKDLAKYISLLRVE